VDHRDCKIYRMVAMPHIAAYNKGQGRWWMAQNLHYTKNLINNPHSGHNPMTLGTYHCPNGRSFNGIPTPIAGNEVLSVNSPTNIAVACETYGAIYGFSTVMSRNGVAPAQDASIISSTNYSVAQGICPKGWVVPGRRDWALLANKSAGCEDDTKAQTAYPTSTKDHSPCNHLHNSTTLAEYTPFGEYDTNIILKWRSLVSGRITTPSDSVSATATHPTWVWAGVGAASKRSQSNRAIDYYGFSLTPAGQLNYSSSTSNNMLYVGYLGELHSSTASATDAEIMYIAFYMKNYRIRVRPIQNFAYPVRCTRAYPLDQ
ncbi:MAG: FISUMP domain-containing protein, partial [Bacteroidales bacterium]